MVTTMCQTNFFGWLTTFSVANPWTFCLLFCPMVLVEVYMLFWTVAFSTKYMFLAWNRILRSRNIRAQGWPPAHLDGDGDAVKHELGEARVLPFVGNEIEAQHPTNDQWVAVLVSFYRSASSFQVVSLDGLEGWEVDVSGPRWRWPARPASARGSS